jgi:phage tail sheath protein FI
MVDPDSGALKWVPRSPIRAAHIARSHSQPGGIANVGAGVDYTLRNVPLDAANGAVGLETDVTEILDDLTQGELNVQGIDVARNFASQGYGLVHWSARTISPEVLFQFLHVPIILSVIAESVERGLKPFVFRVVDGQGRLASEIKGTIDGLLWNLWNDDTLFGKTSKDAFFVKLTSSFTELEQGIINVDIFVKPVPIAERIDVTLFRVALGYDFQTGEVRIGDAELLAQAAA